MSSIKKDDSNKIKQYFLILYQGLRPQTYYWEFVNTLRKVLILLTLTALILFDPFYRILIAVIILVATIRLQMYLQPYKTEKNNKIELMAVTVGCKTLLSGVIFTQNNDQLLIFNTLLLSIIIILNMVFLMKFFYLFTECMSDKYKLFARLLILLDIIA